MAGPDDTAAPTLPSIFFANPTTPQQQQLSYPALLMRQQIALKLAGQRRPYPRNIGEGIANLGESLGERRMMQELAAREQAYLTQAAADVKKATTPGVTAAPVVTPPVAPAGAGPLRRVPTMNVPAAAVPTNPIVPRPAAAPLPAGVDTFDSRFGGFPTGSTDAGTDTTETGTSTAYAPEDASSGRAAIAAALNTAQGVPQPNPTDTGPIAPTSENGGPSPEGVRPEMQPYLTALAGGETAGSRDPYSATGTVTRNGDRAYGKYQIMGANIPQWTQAALGQSMTPEEFLANPNAQDLTAQHRFGSYVDKYGPQGAARAWYAGEGGMNNLGATDVNQRINVGQYGQQFLNRLNGGGGGGPVQVASLDPTMAFAAASPAEAADNPSITTDIAPAPTRLAQADLLAGAPASGVLGGGPARPGPVAPAPVAPGTPGPSIGPYDQRPPLPTAVNPATLPLADSTRRSLDVVAPDPTPITDEEKRANAIRLNPLYAGDPGMQLVANTLAAQGAQKRAIIDKQNNERFTNDLAARNAKLAEDQKFSQERPAKQVELQQKQDEFTQKQDELRRFPGGREPWLTAIKDSATRTAALPATMAMTNRAIDLLNSETGIFSGSEAERQLATTKFFQKIGWTPPDPRATQTEQVRAFVASSMAALRPVIVGPGSQSEGELNLLRQASAGDISLELPTMKKIMQALQNQTLAEAGRHQQKLETYAGTNAADRLFAYKFYGLPMSEMVPQSDRNLLSKNNTPAIRQSFDAEYHTPGLADEILSYVPKKK